MIPNLFIDTIINNIVIITHKEIMIFILISMKYDSFLVYNTYIVAFTIATIMNFYLGKIIFSCLKKSHLASQIEYNSSKLTNNTIIFAIIIFGMLYLIGNFVTMIIGFLNVKAQKYIVMIVFIKIIYILCLKYLFYH